MFVHGFCKVRATAVVAEHNRRFPQQKNSNKKYTSEFSVKLSENDYLPNAKITDRGTGQTLEEVENISQLAEKGAISSSQKVTVKSTKKSSSNTP